MMTEQLKYLFMFLFVVLVSVGCSDSRDSSSTGSGEDDEYAAQNEFGVKLNKIELSRPVDGKSYTVDISGLPISDKLDNN